MPTTYKVTTEPAKEPVTLEALKESLRLLTCDFDEELTRVLTAARRQVEYDCDRKLFTQTVVRYSDEFPLGDTMELRLVPVSGVTSIEYVDADETTQTFASSSYNVDLTTSPPRIRLKDGSSWPSIKSRHPNAVIVTMTAGYADRSSIPAEATLAVLEWAKSAWSGCDSPGEKKVYTNLISALRWTEYHCA